MFEGKRQSFGTAIHYLNGHSLTMKRYLQTFYPPYDWPVITQFFYDNSIQAKVILNDFMKTNDEKFEEVIKIFVTGKSKIVYIVGARGKGKTATAFMTAEETHKQTGRPVYYVAPSVSNSKALPYWCKISESIQKVPRGAFAIVDESAIQFNAREYMDRDNIDMTKLLVIARHKDIFLIFLTQDTELADTNIRRLRDIILWKPSNNYSLSERGNRQSREMRFWQKVRNMMAPRDKDQCLFEYPAEKRFIHFEHGLPECWSESLSKMWQTKTFGDDEIKKEVKPEKLKKNVLVIGGRKK